MTTEASSDIVRTTVTTHSLHIKLCVDEAFSLGGKLINCTPRKEKSLKNCVKLKFEFSKTQYRQWIDNFVMVQP